MAGPRLAAPRLAAPRLAAGEVRERVLAAAEALFAEHGFAGVSFRDLTSRAGVSLSAVHYHFGSKQALLSEVFRRCAEPLTRRRLVLLAAVETEPNGTPNLEMVLEAFLRPAFEIAEAARFNRLRARVTFERADLARGMLRGAFDESDLRFVDAIAAALPGLPRAELFWRFHFLVGAMIYTMADPGQLQGLSQGLCDQSDPEEVARRMVPFFAAALRSPSQGRNAPSRWLPALPETAPPARRTARRASA